MCVRDGDHSLWTCTSMSAEPERHVCYNFSDGGKGCYSARDTQPAKCIPVGDIVETPEGVEPGSDHWLQYHDNLRRAHLLLKQDTRRSARLTTLVHGARDGIKPTTFSLGS